MPHTTQIQIRLVPPHEQDQLGRARLSALAYAPHLTRHLAEETAAPPAFWRNRAERGVPRRKQGHSRFGRAISRKAWGSGRSVPPEPPRARSRGGGGRAFSDRAIGHPRARAAASSSEYWNVCA